MSGELNILDLILDETRAEDGRIVIKVNNLADREIIEALYVSRLSFGRGPFSQHQGDKVMHAGGKRAWRISLRNDHVDDALDQDKLIFLEE